MTQRPFPLEKQMTAHPQAITLTMTVFDLGRSICETEVGMMQRDLP